MSQRFFFKKALIFFSMGSVIPKTSKSPILGTSIFCKLNVTRFTTSLFFPSPKIVQPSKVSTADTPEDNTSILSVKMLPSVSAPRRTRIGGESLPTSVCFIPREASSESNFLSCILGRVEHIFCCSRRDNGCRERS
ncbi:hypothetical protein TNCV_4813261 [Trichonephila clavipes]|nr:hypothetical protein TNCV_4813261 [Trichonephila clavipes]